jgi:hypothetical protein
LEKISLLKNILHKGLHFVLKTPNFLIPISLLTSTKAMPQEFDHLSAEEQLKAENEFLKLKMMLENGAQFGGISNEALPAEIENEFLKNVMAFEQQFANRKTITVFEKIGSPTHFLPAHQIADVGINYAWQQLDENLSKHQINLSACSPSVTQRELYRFATQELFYKEIDEMAIPGWTTNYIYDEFYPDPLYENTKTALEECIKEILCVEPVEYMHYYTDMIRLNQKCDLSHEEFKMIINRFKTAFDDIVVKNLEVTQCSVEEDSSAVKGTYHLSVYFGHHEKIMAGQWQVDLEPDEARHYWYINALTISGISF